MAHADHAPTGTERPKDIGLLILFASMFVAIGLSLVFGSLFLLRNYVLSAAGGDQPEAVELLMLSPFLVLGGALLAILGFVALFDRLVGFKAIVAGKMKVGGTEVPVKIEGFFLVLIALIGGALLVGPRMDWEAYRESLTEVADLKATISVLEDARDTASLDRDGAIEARILAEQERERYFGERNAYQHILTGTNMDGENVEVMRLQVVCSNRRAYWVNWGRLENTQQFTSFMQQGDGAGLPGLSYNPDNPRFFLELGDYQFLVISLDFDSHGLYARIEPTGAYSLRDLCEEVRRQEEAERAEARAIEPDTLAPLPEAAAFEADR
ncbi:hypothetical protein [Boseongicola sp. H5]|uniref:hypothetical protein n=1 Tax=Boseongicola sp. H5 TaxID=2763261 RepID=UPI001D0A0D4F|nr:hypothetical protein [Boseongicola sp. H5]